MKCLICAKDYECGNQLKKHYETIHKINTFNYFLKALFQEKKDNFF